MQRKEIQLLPEPHALEQHRVLNHPHITKITLKTKAKLAAAIIMLLQQKTCSNKSIIQSPTSHSLYHHYFPFSKQSSFELFQ